MEYHLMKVYLIGLLKTLKSSLAVAFTVFSAFLAPIGDCLMFVSLLILFDFITGVVAAKYRNQITSSLRMADSLIKFMLYILILILTFVFDEGISQMFKTHFWNKLLDLFLSPEKSKLILEFKLFAGVAFIMIVRELKSIDENWNDIFGWSFINTTTSIFNKVVSIVNLIKTIKK